jgi:hypothetical protein
MHGCSRGYANADSGNLSLALFIDYPDTRAPINAHSIDSKFFADLNKAGLDLTDKADQLVRIAQSNDGIANELTWAVPGDFPSAVHIENSRAISWAFRIERAFSSSVYRWVLEENESIRTSTGRDFAVNASLNRQGILVLDQAASLKG